MNNFFLHTKSYNCNGTANKHLKGTGEALTIRNLDKKIMPRSDALTAMICYNKLDVYVCTNPHKSTLVGKLSDKYEKARKPVTIYISPICCMGSYVQHCY